MRKTSSSLLSTEKTRRIASIASCWWWKCSSNTTLTTSCRILAPSWKGSWFFWDHSPLDHWDNRIRTWINFTYCKLLKTMGSVSCSLIIGGGFFCSYCLRKCKFRESFIDCYRVLTLYAYNIRSFTLYGRNGMLPSYTEITLGWILKQIFQRRWL